MRKDGDTASNRKRINLALQGGGAHGAFTWGALDRLLEDGRLEIAGICGTSAGAMNATALAYGLARGGPEEARAVLNRFWSLVAERALFSPFQPTPLDRLVSKGDMELSPSWHFYDALSRMVSPYVANPLNYNPLVDILDQVVDFAWLKRNLTIRLFVCATNVKTGKIRVFSGEEISAKAVMASACLPSLFQAVEVEGEYYWDGGFMGNPPIFPLIYETDCEDMLIVQINPIEIEHVPMTAQTIVDRINEISFNSSLMREMRAIAFVQKLLAEHRIPRGRYKDVKIHLIEAEEAMRPLGYSSKLNASADFLCWLRALGRERAGLFLDEAYDKIGVASSVDIAAKFL
ncbi:patatin-like phospholipase family protein [Benzoatithermus flavus]|uniref:Patatin-like phospholipase family protein n=1 Tax=Benzoatithermus flavus TaxID=3108223 RepID=A0ABU8XRT6_9PROT